MTSVHTNVIPHIIFDCISILSVIFFLLQFFPYMMSLQPFSFNIFITPTCHLYVFQQKQCYPLVIQVAMIWVPTCRTAAVSTEQTCVRGSIHILECQQYVLRLYYSISISFYFILR